MGTESSPGGK